MSDEKLDPNFVKYFNTGYYLEKGGRFQDLMKEQKSPKFLQTQTYKALEAGRREAKKEMFKENFKPRQKDKDHEK